MKWETRNSVCRKPACQVSFIRLSLNNIGNRAVAGATALNNWCAVAGRKFENFSQPSASARSFAECRTISRGFASVSLAAYPFSVVKRVRCIHRDAASTSQWKAARVTMFCAFSGAVETGGGEGKARKLPWKGKFSLLFSLYPCVHGGWDQ